MLKRAYFWVLHWAETPHAGWALFFIAVIESSVFPIPPDVLLIALCIGHPPKSLRFASICTLGSVLGGILGYFIGYGLMESVGNAILDFYKFHDEFAKVKDMYNQLGFWAVFIAGLTPIPYKVFTIASGVMKMNVLSFTVASILSRGLRFFFFAILFRVIGPKVKPFLDKYFNYIAWAFGALVIIGFIALKWFL